MYARGTDTGNATAYLVPPEGVTVVSDIDDILRVTKIYQPKEGILNTFARPFRPWMNMAQVYANWSSSMSDMHLHYLTTTPEQITRNYMDFVQDVPAEFIRHTAAELFRHVGHAAHPAAPAGRGV